MSSVSDIVKSLTKISDKLKKEIHKGEVAIEAERLAQENSRKRVQDSTGEIELANKWLGVLPTVDS